MGKLREWADKQSQYVILADGDSITAQYLGFQMIENRFDPKKESVRYLLLIDGEEKQFESSSAAVARQFDGLGENQMVKISREGEGNKTKYTITPIQGN